MDGLASFAPANGDSAIGPHGVFADGNDVYFTNGGPTAPTRGDPPQIVLRDPTLVSEEPISALYGRVFKLRRHGGIRPVADAWAFENEFNPDAVGRQPRWSTATRSTCSSDRGRFADRRRGRQHASCAPIAGRRLEVAEPVPERADPRARAFPARSSDAGGADRRRQGPRRRRTT